MKTAEILFNLNIKPRKSWGQNFLISKEKAKKFVDYCQLTEKDHIIEVGPGLGILTKYLIQKEIKQLILIEIDKKIYQFLQEKFQENKKINLLNNDVLKIDYQKTLREKQKYKVIGNLPYSSATRILIHFLTKQYFSELYFTFSEGIASKILALPGDKKYGFLTVLTQLFSKSVKKMVIEKENFYPSPKVTSVLIKFSIKEKNKKLEYDSFLQFIKNCFLQKRKTLLNNLKKSYSFNQEIEKKLQSLLKKNFQNQKIRAEKLTVDNLIVLFQKKIIKLILKNKVKK